MKGIKVIGISAAAGFLLSFISGLFSRTSIISVLLKAFLFAVVFGILGFLISYVYEKFLSDDVENDFVSDTSAVNSQQSSKTGQVVDITIQDEELDKGESDNHFVINNSHHMLNASDVENSSVSTQDNKKSENNQTDRQGFVPLSNHETVENVSGKEAVTPGSVNNSFSDFSNVDSEQGIDTLPDIGDLAFETESVSESEESEVDSDSGFVSTVNKKSEGSADVKDAALIAKAISSVLSNADSE